MDPQQLQDTVINISKKELSPDQLSLLSKGLSFVPTGGINAFGLKVDLFKSFRQIKLRHFFANKTDSSAAAIPAATTSFRQKSTFCPNTFNASINTFCRLVEQDIMTQISQPFHVKKNLTDNERKALNELIDDENIVIKPADKGGGICIQDKDKYEAEIMSQLSNIKVYKKLKSDPTLPLQQELSLFLDDAKMKGWITQSEHGFLLCQHPVRPVMYTLPKIHKSLIDPPGRPIVAQTNSLLAPLSEFVDSFIKPFVHALPAYIRDSTDLINKISCITDLPDDVFLVTFDVASLYTNIPHDGGVEALGFYLSNRDTNCNPPNQFIIDLTNWVMKKNYFKFNGEFYLQVSGTSMGSICAPNYANLYVGFFEKNCVFNPELNAHLPKILKWYRYIDDVICLYQGSADELQDFYKLLNSFNSNLQFTMEYSDEKVHFLDMWVVKDNSSLFTTLYRKDTDKNTLLMASSFHPTPLKRGLPKSQFFRLRRVCTSTEDYIQKAEEMSARFLQRGYPADCVKKAYDMALHKPRADLLKKSQRKEKKFSITCITTFSPHSSVIKPVFNKHWRI